MEIIVRHSSSSLILKGIQLFSLAVSLFNELSTRKFWLKVQLTTFLTSTWLIIELQIKFLSLAVAIQGKSRNFELKLNLNSDRGIKHVFGEFFCGEWSSEMPRNVWLCFIAFSHFLLAILRNMFWKARP